MILSGSKIIEYVESGEIVIDPFDEESVGPNSCNLTLDNKLLTYSEGVLFTDRENPTNEEEILEEGTLLMPGQLYLGRTLEYTETHAHVPMIEGRSSFARLGMYVHVTGGFGDVGYCGNWTLELSVVRPLIIKPNLKVCQIFYHTIDGEIKTKYEGKYQNLREPTASRIHQETSEGGSSS